MISTFDGDILPHSPVIRVGCAPTTTIRAGLSHPPVARRWHRPPTHFPPGSAAVYLFTNRYILTCCIIQQNTTDRSCALYFIYLIIYHNIHINCINIQGKPIELTSFTASYRIVDLYLFYYLK